MISGLLLGFGVSKYSVGLPVFVYFLLQQKHRAILVGIMVQAIAVLFLAPFKWGSPINTLTAYLKIVDVNYSQDGVHLLARFPESQTKIVLFLIILSTIILFSARHYLYHRESKPEGNFASLSVLNLLTLAIFLITYHRIHDMPFVIFFFLTCIAGLIELRNFSFSRTQSTIVVLAITVIIVLLLLPTLPGNVAAYIGIDNIIPGHWDSVEASSSIALVLMFVLSIWFQLNWRSSLAARESCN
jgi:hypothetical protein